MQEGAWLEPGACSLAKESKGKLALRKYRKVARKIFLEGGWTQKRSFDVDWSDVSQRQACQIEEGTEKHRLYHCSEWHEDRREIPEALVSGSKNRKPQKNEWKIC